MNPGAPAWVERALLALLALLAAFFLVQPLVEGSLQLARHYNEGWNAYNQWRFTHGQPVYPPADALYTNNYTPLSYAVVGGIAKLGFDQIMTGRAVALAAFASVLLLVGVIVARVGGSRWAGVAAGAFLLAYHGAYARDFIALNDPQWLAHAVMTVALLLLVSQPRTAGVIVAAAVLGVTAGMTKHAIISLPLAITLWLLLTDRRAALLWVISGGGALILAIILGEFFFPGFVGGVLSTENVRVEATDIEFYAYLYIMALPLAPAIALTAWVGLKRWQDPAVRLVVIYAGVSAIVGVVFLRGGGTTLNMLFDLSIAGAIGAGLGLARLPAGWWRALALALLVLAVAKALPARAMRFSDWAAAVPMRLAQTANDIALIRRQDGPVLCESLAMCFWAGKPIEVDFFNAGMKMKAGAMDPAPLIAMLDSRHYRLIQLELPRFLTPRVPETVTEAIARNYETLHAREPVGEILAPR